MFKTKTSKTIGIIVAIIVCIVVAVILVETFMHNPEELSYDEFFNKLNAGKVKSVYVEGNYKMSVLYTNTKSKSIVSNPDAYVYIPNRQDAIDRIYNVAAANSDVNVPAIILNDPSKNSIWSSILPIVIGIVLIGVFLFILNRQNMGANNKAMSFGSTKARVTGNVKERFTDVAGAEEEKEELKEIVEFLKDPQKFTAVGPLS